VTVLVTLRFPILDLRPFAKDESIAESVRLPRAWTEGEFVRGTGPLRRRPKRSVEAWPAERCYVDYAKLLRFAPDAIGELNERIWPLCVPTVRRRLWSAIPEVSCIFDFDVLVPVDLPRRLRRRRVGHVVPRAAEVPLSELLEPVLKIPELRVAVPAAGRQTQPHSVMPLAYVEHNLKAHFAAATDHARGRGASLVHSGGTVMVIEMTGVVPILDLPVPVDRYVVGPVEVLTFRARGGGLRADRHYWIVATADTPEARVIARELRIHILRFTSIEAFLRKLVWLASYLLDDTLATEPGPAYDRMQLAMSAVLRRLRRVRIDGVGQTSSLLSGAFNAHEFLTDRSLTVLQARLFGAARPALLAGLRDLLEEEEERARADLVLQRMRDRAGILHIYERGAVVANYDMRGANIGAAGDNARASNFAQHVVAMPIVIGDQTVDRFDLVADLARLRTVIVGAPAGETGSAEAQAVLQDAELAVRAGDGEGARRHLARCGRWVLKIAEATGATVAAAAIQGALGL
jgi:hypothetical protein